MFCEPGCRLSVRHQQLRLLTTAGNFHLRSAEILLHVMPPSLTPISPCWMEHSGRLPVR